MKTAKSAVAHGIAWSGGEKVLVQLVTFTQYLVLARLLSPSDFGRVALLSVFLTIGGGLADTGLGKALVVYGGDVRRVWTWNVAIAGLAYLLLGCVSPWIASFYGEPILCPIAWTLGLTMVIGAAGAAYGACLTREMRFAELAWANVARVVSGAIVGIVLAWRGFGIWAIVWLALVSTSLRTWLFWLFASRLEAVAAPSSGTRRFGQLLSYGWKTMVSSLLTLVYDNCSYLLIGKVANPATVGLFERGSRLAFLPGGIVMDGLAQVMFPRFAALRQKTRQFGCSAGRFAVLGCFLSWPCLVILAIWATPLVRLVLGENWLGCVPYLRVLLIGYALYPFVQVSTHLLMGGGRSDLALKADICKVPILLGLLFAGLRWGVLGICWAKVMGSVVEVAVNAIFVMKMFRRVSVREAS